MKEKFTDYISEANLMKQWGTTKDGMKLLRQKHKLPFVGITKTSRVYYKPAIAEWLSNRKKVLGDNDV